MSLLSKKFTKKRYLGSKERERKKERNHMRKKYPFPLSNPPPPPFLPPVGQLQRIFILPPSLSSPPTLRLTIHLTPEGREGEEGEEIVVDGGEVGLMGGRGVVVCLPRCYLLGGEGGDIVYNARPSCSRAVLLPLFR